MYDKCQAFLGCVILVESSAFKLGKAVCRTAILALPGEVSKNAKNVEKNANKIRQISAILLRKNGICDIKYYRIIVKYYGGIYEY